jgi:hypothetical protein
VGGHGSLPRTSLLGGFKLIHPVIKEHRAWAVAKLFPEIRVAAKYVIDLCAIVRIEDEKLLCDKCGMFYFNIIEHILFSCDLLVELREDLWRDIIHINQIDFSVYRKRRRRRRRRRRYFMYMDSLTSLEFTAELLS